MDQVSTDDLTKHLHHQPRPHFHHINIGPNQTYTYGGTGSGLEFDVHGRDTSSHFANAHLDLTLGSPGFVGTVKLGQAADVLVAGVHATSYNYDPTTHHLNLFANGLAIDGLTIDTGGRGVSVANFPAVSPSNRGGVLISTGRFSLAEGLQYAIPVQHALTS